jgi:hypothetical protein
VLRLASLTVCLVASGDHARAANASLICEPAPGVRFVGEAIGYPTRAAAEAVVRARCREAARKFYARAAKPHRPPPARAPAAQISKPTSQAAMPIQDEACRRYPNLC